MDIPARLPCNPAVIQDWNDVRYAVVIARCGSVAGAARQLGVVGSQTGAPRQQCHRGEQGNEAAGSAA